MRPSLSLLPALLLASLSVAPAAPAAAQPSDAASAGPAPALYAQHCASCHGATRLGGMGPALLPENLGRLKPAEALATIRDGRAATQMPAFAAKLDAAQLQALADFVYTPPAVAPVWGIDEIRASRTFDAEAARLPARPVYDADPRNLFVVVELGDHHVTVLDGDRFRPLTRFASRFALHGGPKFSPEGRFVYFCSRDGWVTKYDLWNLRTVAEVRAGINARNLAVSDDGRFVMVANYLPQTLVLLSADELAPLKLYPVADAAGHGSRVSAVYTAAPRGSFVAALKDVQEVWEIPYRDDLPPVHAGPMQDDRAGAAGRSAALEPRRIALDDVLDDFFFDPAYRHLIGASRDGGKGQVIDLDAGTRVATLDLPGMPHLGSGITWEWQGRPVLATPNLKESAITVIDMTNWQVIKRIPTLGPSFFMRSHAQLDTAWIDVSLGRERDAMQLIDKNTLEIRTTIRPQPGRTAAHVEFTQDGRQALISIRERDGALVVLDTQSLTEITRLPMAMPSGKYNVHNKITRDAGTSH